MDWGNVYADLGATYAWASPETIGRLTFPQLEMYLSRIGREQFFRDRAQLEYAHSKIDEETAKKAVEAIKGNRKRNTPNRDEIWHYTLEKYGMAQDRPNAPDIGLSPAAARGVLEWLKKGRCPGHVWDRQLLPIHESILAAGEQK